MITVVGYGVGNVGSIVNMVKYAGGQAVVTSDPEEIARAEKLILPGVGAFDAAVQALHATNLVPVLDHKARSGTPLLGVCLGMQLLANSSEEGSLPGFGWVPGKVVRFTSTGTPPLKIPHMGWNYIEATKSNPLLKGLETDARFYFVHSYHFRCDDPQDELCVADYGGLFTAGVQRGNVAGFQFHPEKSHKFGRQLIGNFLAL